VYGNLCAYVLEADDRVSIPVRAVTFLSFAKSRTSLGPTHVLSNDNLISFRDAKIGQSLKLNVRFCLMLMPTMCGLWFLVRFHFTGFSAFSRHGPRLPVQDWISWNSAVNRPREIYLLSPSGVTRRTGVIAPPPAPSIPTQWPGLATHNRH
jgi:hypothetical protein